MVVFHLYLRHFDAAFVFGTAVDVNILILTVALRRVDGVSGAA